MGLELEDFTRLVEFKETHEGDEETQEDCEGKLTQIQEFYEKKLKELHQEQEKLIEQIRQEEYQKGFAEAQQRLQKRFEEELQRVVEEKERQKNDEIEKMNTLFGQMEEDVHHAFLQLKEKFVSVMTESLAEILEFLFIHSSNTPYIQSIIEQLLDDFDQYLPLVIRLSPSLSNKIGARFEKVRVKEDATLKENEFIVEFHDFKIESHIQEKLSVLKDEIKRAIEKSS